VTRAYTSQYTAASTISLNRAHTRRRYTKTKVRPVWLSIGVRPEDAEATSSSHRTSPADHCAHAIQINSGFSMRRRAQFEMRRRKDQCEGQRVARQRRRRCRCESLRPHLRPHLSRRAGRVGVVPPAAARSTPGITSPPRTSRSSSPRWGASSLPWRSACTPASDAGCINASASAHSTTAGALSTA
jgi:hypothetical protein